MKGTDVVPPFSDSGVPLDDDDPAAAWNAPKVLSAVGLTANAHHDGPTGSYTSHARSNTKKGGEISGRAYSPSRCRYSYFCCEDSVARSCSYWVYVYPVGKGKAVSVL